MDHTNEESEFIQHEPCPKCGSRDNLARYSDGHAYCFGCEYRETTGEEQKVVIKKGDKNMDFVEGEVVNLSARGITEETCRKWDYRVGEVAGQPVQVANYKDSSGTRIAQKIRFKNKDFHVRGDIKEAGLYGQHLWSGKGKKAIVCEGESFLPDAAASAAFTKSRKPVPLPPAPRASQPLAASGVTSGVTSSSSMSAHSFRSFFGASFFVFDFESRSFCVFLLLLPEEDRRRRDPDPPALARLEVREAGLVAFASWPAPRDHRGPIG